jgi:hypothetical protein
MFAGWLPTRAVPYPTAQEADGAGYNYLTTAQARTNVRNYRSYLSGLIRQQGGTYVLTQRGVTAVQGEFVDPERYERDAGPTPQTAFPEYVAYIRYLLTFLQEGSSGGGAAARTRLRRQLSRDFERRWKDRLREQANDRARLSHAARGS